jgi:hypothetical protein
MIQGFIIIALIALIALLLSAEWLHSHHAPKPTRDDDDDEVDA